MNRLVLSTCIGMMVSLLSCFSLQAQQISLELKKERAKDNRDLISS